MENHSTNKQEISNRVLYGCTLENGEIVEEKLFYDLVGMMKQIGMME